MTFLVVINIMVILGAFLVYLWQYDAISTELEKIQKHENYTPNLFYSNRRTAVCCLIILATLLENSIVLKHDIATIILEMVILGVFLAWMYFIGDTKWFLYNYPVLARDLEEFDRVCTDFKLYSALKADLREYENNYRAGTLND